MSQLESLPKISAPATRALRNAGIATLREVAEHPRSELAALHGMGPRTLGILEASLVEVGRALRD